MITSDELAFVRLAMRRRLLSANVVQEAVERKKWDAPDRPIGEILIDMGVLDPTEAGKLRKALEGGAGNGGGSPPAEASPAKAASSKGDKGDAPERRARATIVGKDPNAREADGTPSSALPQRIGPYQVVRLLGAGAMGAVYHARHTQLERDVALKILQSEGAAPSPRAVQRFKREARLAARLDHPNIVRVWEAGQDDRHHYIAMDLVRGRSVAELVTLGEISARRATHLMRKVAEATDYAHEQGVIHRDLKPANIIVDERSGEPRVTDFGLAVLAEPDEDDKLTRTGAAVGTPAYMAPEQVKGRLDQIDRRTDVYALGATFYEMLTGSPPFDAPTFLELAKKICDLEPVPPSRRNPQVPSDVETVVLKALEKDKNQRYATAALMAKDLGAFLDDAPIVAQRPSAPERARRWIRRHPTVALVVGFLATLAGAAGGFWLSLPGTLEVATIPSGAVVLLDGGEVVDDRGVPLRTPDGGFLAIPVPAGRHQVRFRAPGHLDRAIGEDEVSVGHGATYKSTYTLVSTKGLLRVETSPPGAAVVIEPPQGGPTIAQGTTDFLAHLEQGSYRVFVSPPGGYLPPPSVVVKVEPGGRLTPVKVALQPDQASLLIEADPPSATLRWDRDTTPRLAPQKLLGSGAHEVVVSKPGYLPRKLTTSVAPKGTTERRVTLVPLVAWRRDLEGRLLDGPLVRDVDADGAPDLVALEAHMDGPRLVVLPGGGAVAERFRVATTARLLIDLEDVDGDGVLDVLLGGPRHVELRDGASGRLLATAQGIDAACVVVQRTGHGPARLIYLEAEDRARAVPLTLELGGGGPVPESGLGARSAPRLLALDGRSFTPKAVVAWATHGAVLTWSPDEGGAPRSLPMPGVEPTSALLPVAVARDGDPWLVVVPRGEGQTRLVDPATGRATPVLGPKERLTSPAAFVSDRPWLWLTDEALGTSRAFELSKDGAKEVVVTGLEGEKVGPGAVVLRTGGEAPSSGGLAGPAVWTARGDLLQPTPTGWARVDACSADPEGSVEVRSTDARGRDRPVVVADTDGDGAPELLLPSPDRRSVVALDPSPGRVGWRRPAQRWTGIAPGAALAALDEEAGDDLLLGQGDHLLGLSLQDGRAVLDLAMGGPVRSLAAAPPAGPGLRSTLVAIVGDGPAGGEVVRLLSGSEGKYAATWRSGARLAQGVAVLPWDLDQDQIGDLAVSGPLGVLSGKEGRELWGERPGGPASAIDPSLLRQVGPCVAPGKLALVLGVRDPARPGDPQTLTARDPRGESRWEVPLAVRDERGATVADPVQGWASLETEALVVVVTARRVLGLARTDGAPRWPALEVPGVVGALVAPGSPPRLVVTTAAGELRCWDATTGAALWARRLPSGPRGVTPSAPILVSAPPAGGGGEDAATRRPIDAVLVVAPSGVLLALALDDGAWLAERRSPDAPFAPWLVAAPGGSVVVATQDEQLVALPAGVHLRPQWGRRERVSAQARRLESGPDFARLALDELKRLVREDAADAAAQLALARAHALLGEPEAALAAAKAALAVRPRIPEALRLQAESASALKRPFAEVEAPLEELARVDPGEAARVASALAGGTPELGRFLRRLREEHPWDPIVRRVIGFERLRSIPRRPVWSNAAPEDLRELRRIAGEARVDLLVSLTRQDDVETRASALAALVVERRVTAVAAAKLQGAAMGSERDRLGVLQGVVAGLAAAQAVGGGPRVDQAGRVLELVQLVALSPDEATDIEKVRAVDRALDELRVLRPEWDGAISVLRGLRP